VRIIFIQSLVKKKILQKLIVFVSMFELIHLKLINSQELSKYMMVMCPFIMSSEQQPFCFGYVMYASLAKIEAD